MYYRTKTYLAGDWTGDKAAIDKLHSWNDSGYYSLDFVDVHDFKQASDNSLNCSIKRSLKERMDMCKTFVLVVGNNTISVRSGACAYCSSYNSGVYVPSCRRGYSIDNRSYIEFECDKAVEAGIKIVVLYNSSRVDRYKCPEAVRFKGKHVAMHNNGYWDYQAVKNAIMY